MGDIYLIRHGQASFGSTNYDRLSPKGILQARVLGQHLADLEVTFDAIVLGGMERQKETARQVMDAYLEKGMPIPDPVVDLSWDEIDSTRIWDSQVKMMMQSEPTLLDGLKKDRYHKKAFQRVFSRVMERWVSGKFDVPGVGTCNGFKRRVARGLTHLVDTWGPEKRIAVFSSGGPISIAAQMALDLSDSKTLDLLWQVMNASVTRLKYDGTQITLSVFNDITHLELTGDKTFLTYR